MCVEKVTICVLALLCVALTGCAKGAGYTVNTYTANDGGAFVAIGGNDNPWIPFYNHPSVVELSNSGVPLTGADGYASGLAVSPSDVVVDGSGDVWIASGILTPSPRRGAPAYHPCIITELVGIAALVITPLAAGVQHNMLGARP